MEEKLNKVKFVKRVIIGAWVALAICFVIKLLGGNFFNIICEKENFIAFCNYADNHFWLQYIVGVLNTLISLYFYTLAILGELKFTVKQFIVILATTLVGTLVKLLNNKIGSLFDIWQFIIMPSILTIKNPKRHWIVLLSIGLLFIFQLLSLIVKNLQIEFVTNNGLVISLIYSLDITIMIILYYLYSNLRMLKRR
jgi:hypothetical protein